MLTNKKDIVITIIIQSVIVLLFSFIYSKIDPENFYYKNKNLNMVDYLYFTIVTSSSTGFGDITPKSSFARILVILQILLTYANIIILLFKNHKQS